VASGSGVGWFSTSLRIKALLTVPHTPEPELGNILLRHKQPSRSCKPTSLGESLGPLVSSDVLSSRQVATTSSRTSVGGVTDRKIIVPQSGPGGGNSWVPPTLFVLYFCFGPFLGSRFKMGNGR
jgi:hypothetical protein